MKTFAIVNVISFEPLYEHAIIFFAFFNQKLRSKETQQQFIITLHHALTELIEILFQNVSIGKCNTLCELLNKVNYFTLAFRTK